MTIATSSGTVHVSTSAGVAISNSISTQTQVGISENMSYFVDLINVIFILFVGAFHVCIETIHAAFPKSEFLEWLKVKYDNLMIYLIVTSFVIFIVSRLFL